MIRVHRTFVVGILTAFLGVTLLMPMAAKASEAGRRNTTIGLGAATAYFLAKKKWVPAAALGVGTYYAHHNWQAQIDARHRAENRLRYRHAYRSGYSRGYRTAYHRAHHRTHHRRS